MKRRNTHWDLPVPISEPPTARMVMRFYRHVRPATYSNCVLWTGALDQKGYGNFRCSLMPGGTIKAHRFSWLMTGGILPPGKQLDHRCRNRRCVNPNHLRLMNGDDHGRESAAYQNRPFEQLPEVDEVI